MSSYDIYAERFAENLPPMEERELVEPYYGRQWWESEREYRFFTRYYLSNSNRSLRNSYKVYLAEQKDAIDENGFIDKSAVAGESSDTSRGDGDPPAWWVHMANGKNPYSGEELEGRVMTWDERASYFDMAQLFTQQDKLIILRERIFDDELDSYNDLREISVALMDITQTRLKDFKANTNPKTNRDYREIASLVEKTVDVHERTSRLGRRLVGLPERISEDRLMAKGEDIFTIEWVEPDEPAVLEANLVEEDGES